MATGLSLKVISAGAMLTVDFVSTAYTLLLVDEGETTSTTIELVSRGTVSGAVTSDAGGMISVMVVVGVVSSVLATAGIWIVIAAPGVIVVVVDVVGCCGSCCCWFSVSSFGSTMVTDFLFFATSFLKK